MAKLLLAAAGLQSHRCQLSDEQLAEVEIAKREVRTGKIATDKEMADVWRRFGFDQDRP
jgi:hypothetical protein